MLLQLLIACTLLSAVSCAHHQLLLVSCDGFRYDYLDWYPEETKFLRSLMPRGVHVRRMKPEFATKTFPNHWTIATGLFQESHGIVANNMYDPEFRASFSRANHQERWWNASLPIWINAVKQDRTSATFFWPGSEVLFEGRRATHYFPYNESIPFEYRVQTVLNWITIDRISLTVLYMHEPDSSGHKFGPNSTEVRDALRKVDGTIKSLFDELEKRKYSDKVNVLIVSDHGMTQTSQNRVVRFNSSLAEYISEHIDKDALLGVNPKPGMRDQLVQKIKDEIQARDLPVRVFTKETLPAKYRYSKHRRIPQVLVLANPGYCVAPINETHNLKHGIHGYDNENSDMLIPMFAVGPSFQKDVIIDGFHQIDIYGLMCHLLEIKPQPNNGSLELLPKMLVTTASNTGGCFRALIQLSIISVVWSMGWLHRIV